MLIAPTEHQLKTLGKVSSLPEKWGCDILIRTDKLWVGVQRKAIPDLIASVQDGRLAKEVMQMSACGRLDIKVLLIEGKAQWTNDGVYMGNGYGASWTLAQHRGICWTARLNGLWVDFTDSIEATRVWLKMMNAWAGKAKHDSLGKRAGVISPWGSADSKEFGLHLLQGLPGVGVELAERIYDHFGKVPWEWHVSQAQLMEIPGVGKKKAQQMLAALASTEIAVANKPN